MRRAQHVLVGRTAGAAARAARPSISSVRPFFGYYANRVFKPFWGPPDDVEEPRAAEPNPPVVTLDDGRGSSGCTIRRGSETPAVTVVFLHGMGDTCAGWEPVFRGAKDVGLSVRLPTQSKVILPTAFEIPVAYNYKQPTRAWFDVQDLDLSGPRDDAGLKHSAKRIHEVLAAEDPATKLFVGGFAQGGVVALDVGLRSELPNLAGVIGLSTYMLRAEDYPTKLSSCIAGRKFLLSHGSDDTNVRTVLGRSSHERLVELGLDSDFQCYGGLRHGVFAPQIEMISCFLAGQPYEQSGYIDEPYEDRWTD
ncbi:Alpha/Beta hydrolase protein [Pelagophyceae sp. CCMP2097]|nr:Alpha/Beta hydrolase protein [Pelagophyceae sp. CCMP2097]